MEKDANTKSSISYLYLYVIFCMTFNAVRYWSGLFTASAMIIGVALPFFACRSYLSTKLFRWFLLYMVVLYVNYFSGDEYIAHIALRGGLIGFFVATSLTYFVFRKKAYHLMTLVIKTLCIILLITTISTAFFDFSTPGLVRMINSTYRHGYDISSYYSLYSLGLSDYASPHALPLLVPPLVLGLKNKALRYKQRILSGLILVCCLMLIYFSGASGPMLVSITILMMSLLVHKGRIKSNIIVL